MVESTALEMRRAGNGTVGSNPTLSATDPHHCSPVGPLRGNSRVVGGKLARNPKQGPVVASTLRSFGRTAAATSPPFAVAGEFGPFSLQNREKREISR